jgi:hypothetical protein
VIEVKPTSEAVTTMGCSYIVPMRWTVIYEYEITGGALAMYVGPCHHGTARPHVTYGGTASDMEGSCE